MKTDLGQLSYFYIQINGKIIYKNTPKIRRVFDQKSRVETVEKFKFLKIREF